MPAIVLLVIVANLVGVATVVLLLIGVDDGSGERRPHPVLLAAAAYLVVAFPAGTLVGLRRQRVTNRWLMAGRRAHAAPRPRTRCGCRWTPRSSPACIWLVGAVADRHRLGRSSSPTRGSACASASRRCSAAWPPPVSPTCWSPAPRARSPPIALAAHPPAGALTLGVRPRLLLTWGLTSAVPDARRRPAVPRPEQPRRAGRGARSSSSSSSPCWSAGWPRCSPPGRSGSRCATCGEAVGRVGRGDYDVSVVVDDAGEIGLLQEGVNTMAAGLAERERMRDLFGRHVGTTVADRALATGVSLGGEERTVAALFVDIAGLDVAGAAHRARRRWSACSTASSRSSSRRSRPTAAW